MIELLHLLLFDYTLRTVSLGALALGIFSGALGCFAVLRQQSLIGDAMSHAALPGVALAFMITLTKEPLILLLGAIIAGWVGTLLMSVIVNYTRIKSDAALGIILSVFFGLGMVLLTYIQRLPNSSKSGLNYFLFGNASTLIMSDVILMLILGVVSLGVLFLLWKEFKLFVFDTEFAQSLGFATKALDIALTSLIVIAIVIGLQTVGVVLMSAMVIAPAVAARQWTDRLSLMVVLAAFFGASAGVAGAVTSSMMANLPTGPVIVVFASAFVVISLFLAPNRGLVWDWVKTFGQRRQIDIIRTTLAMHRLSRNHADPHYAHSLGSLVASTPQANRKTLREMQRLGWVNSPDGMHWGFTEHGLEEAALLVDQYGDNVSASEEKLKILDTADPWRKAGGASHGR